ncbi:MAG: hypothetical protein A2445_03920 [Candidatus Jacksonbacteria bacterium RIFOXYC2_FULL_44_29]|nr:MAG: hypothetical protein UV19_C0001G0070 [Parcubacteria group bacterium GW2011_GWA2_42_28]KKT56265.1 MAG: hypothetical protein UW45_C0001G0069 [Parcubacteria group bacterium GW2011_GWC2_44_22]OGY76088.1 MAG: hypothetical protein A2240_00140 [Candidatus Jacksonbacteria bacterium RIFOXYA2_FULL_43_12]OGY77678.1 MAG: hypothetical protein A2295_02640 [Candidatus Jacksonbacteria bacterium RIFOXYB2_FULL_44_15]OGY78814.1 MAG: hypothetical protein A2550_04705 [Candidatus Jacksonbacteria bacterium RI
MQKYYLSTNKTVLSERGYIALISVLVGGAVALMITLSLLVIGVESTRLNSVFWQSYLAKGSVDACAETGLQQIADNGSYTGSGALTLISGTCTYTVTALGGDNRRVRAIGASGTVRRKLNLNINGLLPSINVSSWQEVAD